jgi:hypothetical protein
VVIEQQQEYKEFFPYVSEVLPDISEGTRDKIKNWNLYGNSISIFQAHSFFAEYAEHIIAMIPPSLRMQFYVDSDFDAVQDRVTSFSSKVVYELGFTCKQTRFHIAAIRSRLEVLTRFEVFKYLTLFLGLVINVVVFTLLVSFFADSND